MFPITICRCPDRITSEYAEQVADLVTEAFERVFGRENRLPGRGWPVVCADCLGGWWVLECNDQEITRFALHRFVSDELRSDLMDLTDRYCNEREGG